MREVTGTFPFPPGTFSSHGAVAALSLPGHHGVIESVVGQTLVAFDSRIAERRVFVPSEREHGLVHLLGVEHPQTHEQVEVLHR